MFNQFNRIIAHLYGELPVEEENILLTEAKKRANVRRQIERWRQLLTAYRLAPPLPLPDAVLPAARITSPKKQKSAAETKKSPPKIPANMAHSENIDSDKDLANENYPEDLITENENRIEENPQDEIRLITRALPTPPPETPAAALAMILDDKTTPTPTISPNPTPPKGVIVSAEKAAAATSELPLVSEEKIRAKKIIPPTKPTPRETAKKSTPENKKSETKDRPPQVIVLSRAGAFARIAAAIVLGVLIFTALRNDKSRGEKKQPPVVVEKTTEKPETTAPRSELEIVEIIPQNPPEPIVEPLADSGEISTAATQDSISNDDRDVSAAVNDNIAAVSTDSIDTAADKRSPVIPDAAEWVIADVANNEIDEPAIIAMATLPPPHESANSLANQPIDRAVASKPIIFPESTISTTRVETGEPADLFGKAQQFYTDGKLLSALFVLDENAIDELPAREQRANAWALKARIELKLNRLIDMQNSIAALRELNSLDAQILDKLRSLALAKQTENSPLIGDTSENQTELNRVQTVPQVSTGKEHRVLPLISVRSDSAISLYPPENHFPTPYNGRKTNPRFSTDPYDYRR